MPSGKQIQASLRSLVAEWREYAGTEKAEAQAFLDELMACYGSDWREVGARFEDHPIDSRECTSLRWPQWATVEMKAPSHTQRLAENHQQVHEYWMYSADEVPEVEAARYVVLCDFHRFEVWEPGRFPRGPRASFTLEELPERSDALKFLAGHGVEASYTTRRHMCRLSIMLKRVKSFAKTHARSATPEPIFWTVTFSLMSTAAFAIAWQIGMRSDKLLDAVSYGAAAGFLNAYVLLLTYGFIVIRFSPPPSTATVDRLGVVGRGRGGAATARVSEVCGLRQARRWPRWTG